MGTILFYLLWPLVWFYGPLFVRVRGVLIVDDQILMVKNWFGPGTWYLPGGGHRRGETTQITVVREIREELSVDLANTKPEYIFAEPLILKRAGILMREQFVIYKLDNKPIISKSRELTKIEWQELKNVQLPKPLAKLLERNK